MFFLLISLINIKFSKHCFYYSYNSFSSSNKYFILLIYVEMRFLGYFYTCFCKTFNAAEGIS